MYFSKLTLDIKNPSVRQALGNCQDMHRNLMGAFMESRAEAGVLYRLIEERENISLYVLSKEEPQWEKLRGKGYDCYGKRDISLLKKYYKENDILHFDVLTFPARKIRGDEKNSRRVFLKNEDERKEWFLKQADKYGFGVIEVHENSVQRQITGKKNGNHIWYSAVNFCGYLQITKAKIFWDSYMKGVGAGKAYGLGMMMLAKM